MPSAHELYPIDCPFCKIAKAYPPDLSSPVPSSPDPNQISPQCHLVLSTKYVMAFLDIMPISPGHILLSPRSHYEKVSDMYKASTSSVWSDAREAEDSRTAALQLGQYIPLLSRALSVATGVEDWNVVQNNGARAAQVVPHVHYHLIPRYQEGRLEREGRLGKVDVGALKSWKMFGRGQREDLDDQEGAEMAESIRKELRKVLQEVNLDQDGAFNKKSGKL